jgi:hypothetical protein
MLRQLQQPQSDMTHCGAMDLAQPTQILHGRVKFSRR